MKESKIRIYLLIAGVLVLGLIVYGIVSLRQTRKLSLIDSNKEIVYTNYENEDYDQKVPALNTTFLAKDINNSITEFVNPYLEKKSVHIDYHYQVNGNILSLLIEVKDYESEGAPEVAFKSYIINLQKKKVLTDEETLKLFNLSQEFVTDSINKRFEEYYEDEISKNIIPNMTYQEYMTKRGLVDLANNITLDINKSKLNVYVDYNALLSEEKDYYLADVGYIFEFE